VLPNEPSVTGTIINAANLPLSYKQGSVPDVSGSLKDRFQLMSFEQVTKTVANGFVTETSTPISFWGTFYPFSGRQLMLKPEGQRAWSWYTIIAEPGVILQVDDVLIWNGVQTRVMFRGNWTLYGFYEYHVVQDFTGAGPQTT
jgi:hypothetical protein